MSSAPLRKRGLWGVLPFCANGVCAVFCPFALLGARLRCNGARSRLEVTNQLFQNRERRDLIDRLDLMVVEHAEEDLLLKLLRQLAYAVDTAIKRLKLLEHPLLRPKMRQFACTPGSPACFEEPQSRAHRLGQHDNFRSSR